MEGGDDPLGEEMAGRGGRGAREGPSQVPNPQGIQDLLRQFLQIPTTHTARRYRYDYCIRIFIIIAKEDDYVSVVFISI